MALYSYNHIPENSTFSEVLTQLSYFLDKKNVSKNSLNLYPELLELRDVLYDLEAHNAGGNTIPRFRLIMATSNAEKLRQLDLYKESNPVWNYVLKSFFHIDKLNTRGVPHKEANVVFEEPTSSIGLVSRAKYYDMATRIVTLPAMGADGFVCSTFITDDTGLEINGLACHGPDDDVSVTTNLKRGLANAFAPPAEPKPRTKATSPIEQYWDMLDEAGKEAIPSPDLGNGIPFPGAVSKRLWKRTAAFLSLNATTLVELFEINLGDRTETDHCKKFLALVERVDSWIRETWKKYNEDYKSVSSGVEHILNNLIVLCVLILETKFIQANNSFASLILRTTLTGRDLSSSDQRSVSVSGHLESDNGVGVTGEMLCGVYTRIAKNYLEGLEKTRNGIEVNLDSAYLDLMKQLHGFANLSVHPTYTDDTRVSSHMFAKYFHKHAMGGKLHADIEDCFLAHFAPKNIALTRYMLRELTKFLHLATNRGV